MDSCSLYDVVQEKQRSWLLLTRLVLEVEMEVSMRVFGNPMPRSRCSRKFKFPSSSQNIIWNDPSNQLTNIPRMKTALTLLCIQDSLNKQCAAQTRLYPSMCCRSVSQHKTTKVLRQRFPKWGTQSHCKGSMDEKRVDPAGITDRFLTSRG